MENRIAWEKHGSKRIEKFDFSKLMGDDIIELLDKSKKYLSQKNSSDLLILFDVSDAKFFGEPLNRAKQFAKDIIPYRKKSALIGINGAKRILLTGLLNFTGSASKVKVFENENAAFNWLVE